MCQVAVGRKEPSLSGETIKKQQTIDLYFPQTNTVDIAKRKFFCAKCKCTLIGIASKVKHETDCVKQMCQVCKKIFWNSDNFRRHLRNCPPKKYLCNMCPKMYSRKSDRDLHEKSHGPVACKIVCQQCGCLCLTKQLLLLHNKQKHV